MATKSNVAHVIRGVIATQAMDLAKDPEARRALIDDLKPVAGEVSKAAQSAVRNVKVPQRKNPFDALDEGLDAIEDLLDQPVNGPHDPENEARWRRELASLRAAIPLVRTDQSKGRKRKLKDLSQRQTVLLDEVYAALLKSAESSQTE